MPRVKIEFVLYCLMYYICHAFNYKVKRGKMGKIRYNLVYNRKGRLDNSGKASICICAYKAQERKYIPTGVKITPEQWDKKKQQVKGYVANSIQINLYLKGLIEKVEKYEIDRINRGESVTLKEIVEIATQKEDTNDFIAYFERVIARNNRIKEATKRSYKSALKRLIGFRAKIKFEDITYRFVSQLENYLLGVIGVNTTAKYMKMIKAVVNQATLEGYIDMSVAPFRNYRAKRQPTKIKYLTPEEVERIEDIPSSELSESQEVVRDMFLFSVYTGLRYSDVVRVRPEHIKTIDGVVYLTLDSMQKTGEALQIPISTLFNGKPLELLDRYKKPLSSYFSFTNQFVNRELKALAGYAGIREDLTFHCARHTMATYLLYKGVSFPVVQRLLGHNKITTTQVYAKVMDITMKSELERAFG